MGWPFILCLMWDILHWDSQKCSDVTQYVFFPAFYCSACWVSTSTWCYVGKAYICTHAHTHIFGSRDNVYAVYKQSSSPPVEQLSFAVRTHLEKVGHQMPSATCRALVLAFINQYPCGWHRVRMFQGVERSRTLLPLARGMVLRGSCPLGSKEYISYMMPLATLNSSCCCTFLWKCWRQRQKVHVSKHETNGCDIKQLDELGQLLCMSQFQSFCLPNVWEHRLVLQLTKILFTFLLSALLFTEDFADI